MKKILILVFVLGFIASNGFSTPLEHVNLSAISNSQHYREHIDFLMEHQNYLNGFMPDEHWNAPLSRQELIDQVEAAYLALSNFPEDTNQEYLLLKALVSEYLYHLDAPGYFDKVVENYTKIEELEDRDYRYKWFLGSFYAKAAKPYESMRQFEYIFERILRVNLHPDVIADYAYSEMLACMPKRAIRDYLSYYGMIDVDPNENSLLTSLQAKFKNYSKVVEVPFTELFTPYDREHSRGFFSRLLGLWVPVSDTWRMDYTGLRNRTAMIKFTLSEFNKTINEEITYSILLVSTISDADLETHFKNTLPNLQPIDLRLDEEFRSFEFSDPSAYSDIGGSHGYITFVDSEYRSSAELEIEQPAKMMGSGDDSGLYFSQFTEEFNRFRGPVRHIIMLDSCEYIWEASKAEYLQLLRDMVIK